MKGQSDVMDSMKTSCDLAWLHATAVPMEAAATHTHVHTHTHTHTHIYIYIHERTVETNQVRVHCTSQSASVADYFFLTFTAVRPPAVTAS